MATRRQAQFRVWSEAEVQADCDQAENLFRLRRMNEPLEAYLAEFTSAQAAASSVIDDLPRILNNPPDQALLSTIASNKALFTALRYLAAPPISEDDLDTLLAQSVSATALRTNMTLARSLVDLIRQTIDPKRFPWIGDGTQPTDNALHSAKLATAVASTIQRVQTRRRGDEKKDLEGSVSDLLLAMGYRVIPTPARPINSLEELPGAQQFMTGVTLGRDNGDCVIGLSDRRRLVLECKSSNSALNSRKRLNKEVVNDALNWRTLFGNQVVTGAVLRGVFDPRYVLDAQDIPVMILWGHRLEDLQAFLEVLP